MLISKLLFVKIKIFVIVFENNGVHLRERLLTYFEMYIMHHGSHLVFRGRCLKERRIGGYIMTAKIPLTVMKLICRTLFISHLIRQFRPMKEYVVLHQ